MPCSSDDRLWQSRTPEVDPTYPDAAVPIAKARRIVEKAVREHIAAAEAWDSAGGDEPPVHLLKASTGVGKTRIAARVMAERIRTGATGGRPYLYAVPTHRLGDEIVLEFARAGVRASVFRGRMAENPDRPGDAMCNDLGAVSVALELGATVQTSACRGKAPDAKPAECPFFRTCAYQAQKTDKPDVWIVAHQMLFQPQVAIGKVAGVFIDESFWQAGVWTAKKGLTVDEIEKPLPFARPLAEFSNDLEPLRNRLARALRRGAAGGARRADLVAEGLTEAMCGDAVALEWRMKPNPAIWPGMDHNERAKAAKAAAGFRHVRSFANAWKAARDLLRVHDADAVSGRLILADLETDHGQARSVITRGVKAIATQWRAPTLIMDATLPPAEILTPFFPTTRLLADVEAAMPHLTVRQCPDAPTSANKLLRSEGGRKLAALRRAILRRHLEVGRMPTLVVAQKEVALKLREMGLPSAVSVEWFNNLAGLDRYKDVRLLIVAGRTLPTVFDVEAKAGTLAGVETLKAPEKAGPVRWYAKTTRGVRMREGTGRAVETDIHPDPTAEAARWQVCEAELIQAIGRARGVNRTEATPLDLDIWTDVVLPVTVDALQTWRDLEADAGVEMAVDGVRLANAADMSKAWPNAWQSAKAAEHWRARAGGVPQSPIEEIIYRGLGESSGRYRKAGLGQKWCEFSYDPSIVADPRTWLETRLGPLVRYETVDDPANYDAATRTRAHEADEPLSCQAEENLWLEREPGFLPLDMSEAVQVSVLAYPIGDRGDAEVESFELDGEVFRTGRVCVSRVKGGPSPCGLRHARKKRGSMTPFFSLNISINEGSNSG